MDRLLITGGSGLLGLNWACSVRDRFDAVLATHRHSVQLAGTRCVSLELESPAVLMRQIRELAPRLIVHTAGMTSVEQCERFPLDAERANVTLAQHVAVAARELGIKLVHVSTDHLFAGDRAQASEEDEPQPLNVYARTKLQAERLVREVDPAALIVRTNFFGWGHAHRQSFSDWIVNSLRAGKNITMFDDVFFSPILADTLALTTHDIVAKDGRGVYNVVGETRVSKFDFANQIADCFGLSKALITRGRISDSSLSVTRPRDMSLDNAKVRNLLQRNLGSVNDFLAELHWQEQQGRAAELRNAVTEK